MVNGSATLSETNPQTRPCPDGCISRHGVDSDPGLHAFPHQEVSDVYGKPVVVAALVDDRDGRVTVAVGEHEFYAEDADRLANLLRRVAYETVAANLSRGH